MNFKFGKNVTTPKSKFGEFSVKRLGSTVKYDICHSELWQSGISGNTQGRRIYNIWRPSFSENINRSVNGTEETFLITTNV